MKAIYAGSFNPIHLGHMDIIKRAVKIFGNITVVVANNSAKGYTVSIEDRIALIRQAIEFEMLEDRVKIIPLEKDKSMVDFCREEKANVLIRGIRSNVDMTFELMMAEVNSDNKIETIFLPCYPSHSNYSSTMVRECIKYNLPISKYVPVGTMSAIKEKYEHSI